MTGGQLLRPPRWILADPWWIRRAIPSRHPAAGVAAEEHSQSFAATEMNDGAGGRAPRRTTGDGALSGQELEFLESSHWRSKSSSLCLYFASVEKDGIGMNADGGFSRICSASDDCLREESMNKVSAFAILILPSFFTL